MPSTALLGDYIHYTSIKLSETDFYVLFLLIKIKSDNLKIFFQYRVSSQDSILNFFYGIA